MTVTGEFLKNKDVKVAYVRDIFGYKKGVVVKIGRGKDAKYGWSLSNKSDGDYIEREIHQLPVFHGKKLAADKELEIVKVLFKQRGIVRVPYFDTEVGKVIALSRALKNKVFMKDDVVVAHNLPIDKDLINVIRDMIEWDSVTRTESSEEKK